MKLNDKLKQLITNIYTTNIIIAFILLILFIILVRKYLFYDYQRVMKVFVPKSTRIDLIEPINGDMVPLSSNGVEFTYNFWMFIRDWQLNYDVPKLIFYRSSVGPNDYTIAAPSVWLYPKSNILMVRVSTLATNNNTMYDSNIFPQYETSNNYSIVNPNKWPDSFKQTMFSNPVIACDIQNIPLLKWMNINISYANNSLDISINGKLMRSCQLNGPILHNPSLLSKIYFGGQDKSPTFNGYLSRFMYVNYALSSDEVYNIYQNGPESNSNMFSFLSSNLKLMLNYELI